MSLHDNLYVDQLHVRVYADRRSLGAAAALEAATHIREQLRSRGRLRIVFAAAPSQNEFLDALAQAPDIDWRNIEAFHMDEYIGIAPTAPQRFSHFLSQRLFDRVRPGRVHLFDCTAPAEAECARYARLLAEAPIDVVCLGIGENGHIAFNDPPVADFADPLAVKPVELEEHCRRQQVNDGCFPSLDDVPRHALTLTIPTIMSAARLFCIVPGPTKREAVRRTLTEPISVNCPSTILRTHANCTLYVDAEAYG